MTDQITHDEMDRRGLLHRLGQWSIGVAVTVAGIAVGTRPASASVPGGCCNLIYNRYCDGREWSVGCGRCTNTTLHDGSPDGKWWWSCFEGGQTRFCGECWNRSCSYTFLYSGAPVQCN